MHGGSWYIDVVLRRPFCTVLGIPVLWIVIQVRLETLVHVLVTHLEAFLQAGKEWCAFRWHVRRHGNERVHLVLVI